MVGKVAEEVERMRNQFKPIFGWQLWPDSRKLVAWD
jgi:hypothetical protein